jgi:hypothetical protein
MSHKYVITSLVKKGLKMKLKKIAAGIAIGLLTASAYAGPFILAGTDADDHGSATAVANLDGWLFMQKGLENIAANVTNGKTTVAIMGSTSTAATAANSAFGKSSIASTWNIQTIGLGGFADFFGGVSTININTVGILLMDSGISNVGGGVSGSNFVAYASGINAFVGAGGGLFSQANGYQWLTALLPSVTTPSESTTGLSLTAAGNSNFPGLTNADLSAGPYHERFEGYGAIPVLATSNATGNAIIIGGVAGSITNPGGGTVPEPGSLLLVGAGLLALLSGYKKRAPSHS